MLRASLLVTLALVGASRIAAAQPGPDHPEEPPPTAPEPPPPIPTPADDDPVALAMIAQAHSAALASECERVEMFAYKVRSLSPETYRRRFATDAAIIACDPRVQRRERAAALDRYHATGLALSVGVAVAKRISVQGQPITFATLGNNTSDVVPAMRAYVGYQGPTLDLGASLAFARATTTDNSVPGNTTTFSTSSVVIGPAARLAVWHSREARAQLLLAGEAAVGWAWTSTDPLSTGAMNPPSDFLLRVRAGLGLRYWLAPSFAVALVSAVQIDYAENHTNLAFEVDTTNTAIVNQLELLGVF